MRNVTTAAGERYRGGALHRWILGRHHREVWAQPIRVRVLDLDQMAGGLTPVRKGGGMQTKSLRFIGADGREYTFRSVDKDPSAVLDPLLRETIVDDLVQDGISAAHPFGALVADPLLDAAGILHADPRLRLMPDDPALGEFRGEFAGVLGIIEEHPDEIGEGGPSFRGTARVIGTDRLTERLDEGPADRVDAREYLAARLMDLFLGDWDRHRDQWRWATYDGRAPRRWLPVPRDRDQVFSNFDGVATRIASLYVPQLVRFGPEYPDVVRLHWNGRDMDRWFLAELDREAWDDVGARVESALTDEVIERAVRHLPPEIHEIQGMELGSTLRRRRDGLRTTWRELYETIAAEVDVRATDADETVSVDLTREASVEVRIVARDGFGEPYFVRRFLADETHEIRIYLRDGDDRVVVSGDANTGIVVRIIGGGGDDRYVFEGHGTGTRMYDHQGENTVSGDDAPPIDNRAFEEWEWSPDDRNQPRDWGHRTLPIFWSSYASDLGAFLGAGVRLERYGFRRLPYASAFDARAGFSPGEGKGRVEVDTRFNRTNSPFFWTASARVSGLDVLHYYGLGNHTAPGGEPHHRVDVTRHAAAVGIGVSPAPRLEVSGMVQVERTGTRDDPSRFLSSLGSLYGDGSFTSLGIGARARFDPLEGSERIPHRIRLTAEWMVHPGVLDVEGPFGRAGGEVSVLWASSPRPAISFAARAAAEGVFGRFPWHEAAFIGGRGTVRGWHEQRFAGDAAARLSGELRLRVLRPRLVVPTAVGVFGFVDLGRVWVDGASPGGWHAGVGAGVYLHPVGQPYLVKLGAATSAESTKLLATIELPY